MYVINTTWVHLFLAQIRLTSLFNKLPLSCRYPLIFVFNFDFNYPPPKDSFLKESHSDRVMFFTDQGRFHQFSFYIQILATFEEFGHSDHCLFAQGKFP